MTELFQLAPKDEMARFANVNQSRANLVVRTGEVGSARGARISSRGSTRLLDEVLPPGIRGEVDRQRDPARAQRRRHRRRAVPVGRGGGARDLRAASRVALRSWKLGVIAMIPNLLPVAMFFGLLGLGAAPLSLPTSLIGAVALGIAIDDTVHFLVRYRRERKRRARRPRGGARHGPCASACRSRRRR